VTEPTQLPLHLREPASRECAKCARALELADAFDKARREQLERAIRRLVAAVKANVLEIRGCKVVPIIHLFDALRDAEAVLDNDRVATNTGVVHLNADASCCKHYSSNDPTFVCAECNRRVGWCMGRADDHPDVCDNCYVTKGCAK